MLLFTVFSFSIFLAVILTVVGTLVVLRNPKNQINRLFFIFCLISALWSLAFEWTFYLFVSPAAAEKIEFVDILNRTSYFLGILLMICMASFTFYFSKLKSRLVLQLFVGVSFVVAILSLTPLISGTTTIDANSYVINPGKLIPLYLLTMLSGAILIIYSLLNNYTKQVSLERKRTNLLIFAFSTSILFGLLFAVVSPIVFPDKLYDVASPLALLLLIVPLALAITSTKLFDLKFALVRSLGYIFSLATVFLVAAFTVFGVSNWLVDRGVSEQIRTWVFVVLTLILSVSYQPIKRTFDTLTRRMFYRDAYDTPMLLNEFNEVMVSTIDLNQLLLRAGQTIEKYLKPLSITFAVRDSEADSVRLIAIDDTNGASVGTVDQIRTFTHKNAEKLYITDLLDETQLELKRLLQDANIAVLARITTDINVEGTGYIVMGYKKSGNIYNAQDIGAIEILANELAIAMQNALQFEEIQRFNVTLQDKIDNATRKLKRTNDKLKQMDETKDEFISMASHQLRTPLTSVKGYLSMVLEGDAGEINEMQHKLLDQAFISSQRMVYLIADLLNVSRLRTGKFVIEPVACNLADVIESEVHQLIETAEARGLTLTYNKPENFTSVMVDETKLRQVIMNFMDNAIYYSTDGGHIVVDLKEKGDTIEYTVTDDGIGVPKAEQHHLFTKFYRAANAKKARPDGTGLGLFMARKVVVAQGGTIIFKSESGKGSVFGFSFQKSKLQAMAEKINNTNATDASGLLAAASNMPTATTPVNSSSGTTETSISTE